MAKEVWRSHNFLFLEFLHLNVICLFGTFGEKVVVFAKTKLFLLNIKPRHLFHYQEKLKTEFLFVIGKKSSLII